MGSERSLNRFVQVTFGFPTDRWHFAQRPLEFTRLRNGFLSHELSSQPPSNFAMFSQGKVGLRNEFAQVFQILHRISQGKAGLRIFRKTDLGLRNFRKVDLGLRNFCKLILGLQNFCMPLRIALFFLLQKKN